MRLPEEPDIPPQINIVPIDANNRVFLNRQALKIEDLPKSVRTLIGNQPEALVVLNADERVSHGQVISVMDRLRTVPGVRLAIQAERL
jgi:biopolymer transport protein ExbD